ncbi:unnamed protein product [Menidia menidia]|uniref:(Atlantic silverside) hypothetical protein n=1 Tax=Menidia menidia TaxID=238744 RepID=A0A8S4BKS8_9TELE|nr:unnamed protein product [Menidia menidia]
MTVAPITRPLAEEDTPKRKQSSVPSTSVIGWMYSCKGGDNTTGPVTFVRVHYVCALTTCFIIVCGEKAAYQRAAGDGFYHSIEDIDRKPQQCGPTVNDSFIHIQILVSNLQFQNLHLVVPLFYNRGHRIGQSQDALPVDPGQKEAVRRRDGSDVHGDGPIWALRDGDAINAQLTFPVALGVPDSYRLTAGKALAPITVNVPPKTHQTAANHACKGLSKQSKQALLETTGILEREREREAGGGGLGTDSEGTSSFPRPPKSSYTLPGLSL